MARCRGGGRVPNARMSARGSRPPPCRRRTDNGLIRSWDARRGRAMIFTQHYLACLSHGSYVIGDEATGRAVVVDPRRDIDVYLEEAATRGLTIERVIETHLHADFL